MNIPRKSGLILALAFAFSLPFAASAEEVSAHAAHTSTPAAATEQSAAQPAAQPMQSMQDMMREMRRDPSNCKTMKNAAADAPAPMPGMGMMGMGMGMGPGKGMHGENCKTGGGMDKPCMQGQHMNCHMRGGADDQRLDLLEKRVDMMQMMMEMMMRSGRH